MLLQVGPRVGVSGIFLRGFPLKFFGILLQSILVGRLRKAGGKTTGALCLGAAIVGLGIGRDTAPCQGQRELARNVANNSQSKNGRLPPLGACGVSIRCQSSRWDGFA
jgi:hypothetical protein